MTAQDHPHARLHFALLGPLLREVGRQVQGSVEARFGVADINYTQWRALCAIYGSDSPDSKTLAVELGITPGTVTRIVSGLEARGLVSRERSTWNGQAVRPMLTSAGVATLREIAPVVDQRLTALGDLADSEIETLMQLLGRLSASISRHALKLAYEPMEA